MYVCMYVLAPTTMEYMILMCLWVNNVHCEVPLLLYHPLNHVLYCLELWPLLYKHLAQLFAGIESVTTKLNIEWPK